MLTFISLLSFAALPALQAEEAVETLMVQPILLDPAADQPPEELQTLLYARLSGIFPALGGFETVASESESGVLLTPTIQGYVPAHDETLGVTIELRLMLELQEGPRSSDRNLPYRTEIKAIGNGETHSAAMLRAVDGVVREYRRRLLDSPVFGRAEDQAVVRVKDTLAGRVILNRGARNGLEVGSEYQLSFSAQSTTHHGALLKLAAVYPEFAEAHVVYGRQQLGLGTRLDPVPQLGLRTAIEGNYVYRMGTRQTVAEHLGGVSVRLYYDRELFSISPLLKVDYLTNQVTFLHTGTALNWHVGRLTIAPTLLGGVGFSAGDPELYWGASVEMVLAWRINRRWLFSLDAGASGWYCTGEEFQEARFIYAGSGFMLKY